VYGDVGHDVMSGGPGLMTFNGGDGNDEYVASDFEQESPGDPFESRSIVHGNGGNDIVNAGAKNDLLYGDDGNDHIWGDWGNDRIEGGSGNDNLEGSVGNDVMLGGTGNDVIYGQDGFDTLTGNVGNDIFAYDFNEGDGLTWLRVHEANDVIADFVRGQDKLSVNAHFAFQDPEGGIFRSHKLTFADLDTNRNSVLDSGDDAVDVVNRTLNGSTKLSTVIDVAKVPELTAVFDVFGTITLFGTTGMKSTDIA
jgi:hypothetical protein